MNPVEFRLPLILVAVAVFGAFSSRADAKLCDASKRFCGYAGGYSPSSSSGSPSRGGKVKVNPSAVPVEKGTGVEFIIYKGTADYSLVKGLGRVGAAISPSASEEAFFGPPGLEDTLQFEARKSHRDKYSSQKYTLATAFGLFNNKSQGLDRFELNLGVMGKYNRETQSIKPGGGLSGILGPLTFGYSAYQDEFYYDGTLSGQPSLTFPYSVQTYSIGLFLNVVALDYSVLNLLTDDDATMTTTVSTATIFISNLILIGSLRNEKSPRPYYNFESGRAETREEKSEVFFGAQLQVADHFVFGAFYNYYLLREYSFGITYFF